MRILLFALRKRVREIREAEGRQNKAGGRQIVQGKQGYMSRGGYLASPAVWVGGMER